MELENVKGSYVEGLLVCAAYPRSPTVYASLLGFWPTWLPGSEKTFTDSAAGALAGQISMSQSHRGGFLLRLPENDP
jgi:hypothetical protein